MQPEVKLDRQLFKTEGHFGYYCVEKYKDFYYIRSRVGNLFNMGFPVKHLKDVLKIWRDTFRLPSKIILCEPNEEEKKLLKTLAPLLHYNVQENCSSQNVSQICLT